MNAEAGVSAFLAELDLLNVTAFSGGMQGFAPMVFFRTRDGGLAVTALAGFDGDAASAMALVGADAGMRGILVDMVALSFMGTVRTVAVAGADVPAQDATDKLVTFASDADGHAAISEAAIGRDATEGGGTPTYRLLERPLETVAAWEGLLPMESFWDAYLAARD